MSDAMKPVPAHLALTAGHDAAGECEETAPPLGAAEVIVYIEEMCGELAQMSASFEFRFLSYLLRVAQEEAAASIGPQH